MSMISEKLRKARQGVKEEDTPAAQALRLAAYGAASGRSREREEQEAQGLQSLRLAAYGAAQDAALANARRPAPSYAGTLRAVPDSGTGTSVRRQYQDYLKYIDLPTGARMQEAGDEAGLAKWQQDRAAWEYNQRYGGLSSAPDYAEKSRFRSRANGKPVSYALTMTPGVYSETGYDSDADLIYNAVNGDENARKVLNAQGVSLTGSAPVGLSYEGWYDLPEATVRNFNYIFETQGAEAALGYLDESASHGYTPSEAFAWGALQGSGAASLAEAAGSVIAPKRAQEAATGINRAMGRAQAEQPLSFGAGSTTATLAQMAAIGQGVGSIGALGKLPDLAQRIIRGAATFGGSSAIQNIGAAATGNIGVGDYLGRVGTAALGGATGAAAGGLISQAMGRTLTTMGLTGNKLARSISAGISSAGFAAGSAGVQELAKYLQYPEGYELDAEEVTKNVLVAFALGTISYLTSAGAGAQQSTAAEEAYKSKYFDGMTVEEAKAEYRRLAKMYHPDLHPGDAAAASEMQQINDDYARYVFVATAANDYREATTSTSAETASGAAERFTEDVRFLQEISNSGILSGTQAEEAIEILSAAAAELTVGAATPTPQFPYMQQPYGADILAQAALGMTRPAEPAEEETAAEALRKAAEAPAPVKAEDLKGPDFSGWDRIINEDRVSGMSDSEKKTVQRVFAGKNDGAPATTENAPGRSEKSQQEQLTEAAREAGLGEQGVNYIGQFYYGDLSPSDYFGGFSAFYNAGKAGEDIGGVSTPAGDALTDVQKQGAWNAGRMDAMTENAEVVPYEEVKTPTKQENKPKGGNYFVPGEKSGLPYDIVVEKIPVEEPAAPAYNEENAPARSEQEENAQKPHEVLASNLRAMLASGRAITSKDLAALADQAFGGTRSEGAYDIKTAYDTLELAVNQHLLRSDLLAKGNGNAAAARMMVKRLQALLDKLPTQTVRTEEQQQFQQFSTPPNIASLAAWAANITPSDVVLEPSAGIGGLAVFPKAWGATVYGNELSPRRAEILRSLGLDEVFTENAEQINNVLPDYVQPSVVLMNPPFSSTAGRTATNSTANAKRHIEQALARLNDGGRLVAILGRGMANDSKTFASWWNELRNKYSIRANLSINGENYKKYGTTFDVQLVVIDKTGPQQGKTVTGEFRDLTDIPAVLEGIRNDRIRNEGSAVQPVRGSSERGNQPASGSGSRGNQSGRLNGGAERADGGAARNDGAAVPSGPRNGRRGELAGAGSQVQSAGEISNGIGESRNAGAAAAESGPERDNRFKSELPVQGLSQEAPKAPRKSGTKAAKSDDGVYSEYQPPKTPVKGAKKHPAVLVESAAMGAVEAPPATYKPNLPKELIESGGLSDAQITNVVYAGQAHSQMIPQQKLRKGYFIGDGTGVGKGRQIGGIILDNFRQGRTKALWISKGQNLFPDAQRDWTDIGGNAADVFSLSKIKADNAIPAERGILFTTYDTLASTSKGSGKSRLDQIVDWLGKDFDGVIAFDEAHNMGNLLGKKGKFGASKPAQKAIAGAELQKKLPNARVVYVSATMATDVNEMAFAERLGLWGPGTQFNDVRDFVSKISDGGIAAMELVARDMKAMGVYQARSISYKGVQYETLEHTITPVQKDIYDTMSRAWQVTLQNMNQALDMTGGNRNGQARAAAKSAYYGAMQRFYNQVLTSMAVPSVIKSIRKDLDAGKSVVIQIVNTNEAETNRQLAAAKESGGSLDDLDITPREALLSFLRNSFPIQVYEEYTDENGNQRTRPVFDSQGNPVIDREAVAMRDRMIEEIQAMRVPEGPLEMIFDAFGVEQVAEVTGRKRRVVTKTDENGNRAKVEERRSDKSNEADVQAFQDGEKRILIFSDAGGTGKSYHADRRAKNQQQRVHYLLQPGWSAPKAVQGFGRTHRSNEVSAPIYKLVTTDVRGQKRFVSTIARRLDQLGALTKGQRQTGSGMFSEKDNLESELALDSLWNFYKALGENRLVDLDGREILEKLGLADKFYDENGAFRMSDTAGRDMATFLNRILALEYDEQNAVFDAFSRIFDDAYDTALANGTLDMGMETIKADKIEILDDTVIRTDEATGATTNYVQAKISQKTKIIPSVDALRRYRGDFVGLYRRKDGHVVGVFRTADKTETSGNVVKQYLLQTPVEGRASKFVEKTLEKETTPIPEKEWKTAWAEEIKQAPEYNEYMRHMLTGTLLPIWKRLPTGGSVRVQRLIADDGRQYLGRVIQPSQIDGVLKSLGAKGRTKQSYTAADVVKQVFEKGKKAALEDDHVVLTRRRVGNEWRIEITGDNPYYLARTIPGVYDEYINYQRRFFIRNGEQQEQTVAEILKNNPVRDIEDAKSTGDDGVQYSRDGGLTPHPDEWTARRVGDSNKKPMSTAEIVEKIRHDFGINVTTGHVRGQGVRGQYNPQDQGIRTRIENDLPTLSHELGHHLDDVYDLVKTSSATAKKELTDNLSDEMRAAYKDRQLLGEGLAEFVRRFLQNRETAAIDYPEFTAHFLNSLSGPDQARIEVLADEINAYYSLDADTAQSSIVRRADKLPDARTWTEKVKDKAGVFYQAFVDSNYGIKRFDEATGSNAYKLATISAYADNRAGAALVGDLYDAEGAYVCPGLKSCFAGHEDYLSDKSLYADLNEYLVVKHGPERLAEGKRVFADDRKNSTAWMNRRQMELERQHPALEEISDRLYEFQRTFLETWGVNTGLVTRKAFDEWGERWEYYVPFNRAVSMEQRGVGARRGFANQDSTIKKAVGSGKQILSPVDNIIHNMVLMVNAGLRNNVMRRIRNGALSSGDATFMEKVQMTSAKQFDLTGIKKELSESVGEALLQGMIDQTGADVFDLIIDRISDVMTQFGRGKAHGNIVTVMVNGKPEFWKINDPQLLESITSLSPKKMGAVMEAYATVSRFMAGNITGNNLLWSIFSNFPRDLMTLFTYAPVKNPLKVFSAMGSAYLNSMRGDHADAIYKEYLAMGSGQGESAYTADLNLEKRIIEKLHKKGISANPLDWISWASDRIEMGPRFATYKLLREAGMSPEEAFYGSQDVTVNFRRGGRIARELNKVIPFFNAGVQGLDKFGRWITANDVPRADRAKVRRGRMIGFLTASAVLATLFYALNNRDDKSKKEYQQLSNYTKNSYWNIPLGDGKYFAIPKPRELAVLSSFFETCMERFGGNEHAYDEFYEYATDTILPNVAAELSQGDFAGAIGSLGIIGVGADLMANRDFLGRPIVSSGLQNLEPKDQYTSRTSMIARAIGEAFNVSPQKVDFFFYQVLGGWWKAQKALFPVGGEEMDLTMGIQNSYIKDNQYSTDLINRLYDYAASSQAAKNSAPDNADKALRAKLDSNMTTFYSRYYALARANGSSTAERGTRQEVLNMIAEYIKAMEHGYETKTEKNVYRIAKESGEVGTYLPSVMPVTVKDGKEREHSLSDVQYVQYQLDYNTTYWQTVEAALPRAKNDTERAAIIKAAKQAAKDRATERLLRRLGAPLTGYNDKYEGVTDTQITVFRGLLDVANDDGSLKQEEVIDILDRMKEQMSMSDDAASALFHTQYDSDKNNPYK